MSEIVLTLIPAEIIIPYINLLVALYFAVGAALAGFLYGYDYAKDIKGYKGPFSLLLLVAFLFWIVFFIVYYIEIIFEKMWEKNNDK